MVTSLKWILRLSMWAWVGYWISQIFFGDLGASPALELNHRMGDVGLVMLTVNLLFGIFLDIFSPPPKWARMWISERRIWGVSGFLVICLHIGFYFLNESFESQAWSQLVTKTYLIFALLSFSILFVLALTSNNWSVRRLGGKNWKRLHRLVYLMQLLLLGHILLIEKADLIKYGSWLILLLVAQSLRWTWHFLRKRRLQTITP